MNEEEKAIERCKELIKPEHSNWIGITNQKAIEIVLNLIDKQNKVIEEAIEYIENAKKELYGCGNYYLLDLLKILKGVKYE